MKKNPLKPSPKASVKVQDLQTIAIVVLAVAVVVLISIVAVLFAQVGDHRESISDLYDRTKTTE